MHPRTVILLVAVAVLLAAAVVTARRSDEPIQVVGHLSKDEVRDIRGAVARRIREPILPILSPQGLREVPRRIWQRLTKHQPKIWRIERRTDGFVASIGRLPAGPQTDRYVFWCVFRETNNWWVEAEYHLSTYDPR